MNAVLEKTYRLSEAWLPYLCALAHQYLGLGLRAGTGPLEVGAKTLLRLKRGRRRPPGKERRR